MRKRILLAARYYSIEPLGILYLTGLARDAGWDASVVLVREHDFEPLYRAIRSEKPDLVGLQIWTGYHLPAFAACDAVRRMGVPVVIGGPHATYFGGECARHADYVIRGGGFGLLKRLLAGELAPGAHFDVTGREDHFPQPDRAVVYDAYPELGESPIKSLFSSVGCPFTCTYCYAPTFNDMHGGFKLTMRPVDEVIREAQEASTRWPTQLFYFQDDIWGYDKRWLAEFARRWPEEVGVPFHAQIRLELTRHQAGDERLDLFAQAGCSGITLAIESGNDFLRDHVLFRHMPGELIEEGCAKIMGRGMTLRTEQILAVPFSDTATDLSTVALNGRINPTMMWTSILAPYAGTDMGTIATNFGLYGGNNDDLAESFFDRSVLRHVAGGPRDIEAIVRALGGGPRDRTLLALRAASHNPGEADIVRTKDRSKVGHITYLSGSENERYCRDVVRIQRLANFLAKVPAAETLGRVVVTVPEREWSWQTLGRTVTRHLEAAGCDLAGWERSLAAQMGYASPGELPEAVRENPYFFCFFPAGGALATQALESNVFNAPIDMALDQLGTLARRHLFAYGLYKIEQGPPPIAH